MKTIKMAILAAAVTLTFTACKKEIDGSGKYITQTRNVSSFDQVVSSGDFNVILVEDPVSRVVLHGEDNILPEIETEVSGSLLKIYYEHHHYDYDHHGVTITIYNPSFKGIDLQGSGRISNADTLRFSSLNMNVSGSGRMDLVTKSSFVNSNISGSGSIHLSGSSGTAFHKISGSGNLFAFDLVSNDVSATISGSGVCRVHAGNKLTATISGSGDVIYRGSPQIVKNISGSGQVKPE